MRGAMEFDDFNYRMHNQYILRLDPKENKDGKKSGIEMAITE